MKRPLEVLCLYSLMDSTATVAANIQGAIVAWRCHGHKPGGTIRGPPADLPKASHGSIWILLGWTGTGWLQGKYMQASMPPFVGSQASWLAALAMSQHPPLTADVVVTKTHVVDMN